MPHRLSWKDYVERVIGDDKQIEVARRTGIDQGTISRWLRADSKDSRASISSQAVRAFAIGYNLPVLEAFVVAGFLTEDEAGQRAPRLNDDPTIFPDWTKLSDARLATELGQIVSEIRRRLVEPRAWGSGSPAE